MKINKNLIISSSLANQNELIGNLDERINALNTDATSQENSDSQSEHHSAGTLELVDALNSELAFAVKETEYLKTLDSSSENTHISSGAVVITDQLIFFIGISSEKIEIDGNEIISISTKAPIYASMKGLKKGETFTYNEMSYEIKDIY
ncbi:hypothetical protein SAMN05444395_102467 [Flavobacterium fryxellicola]|uniref:Transcription elongation factor n=1 Tax=Flavobacterium fryxellicola TaxID=249352 RepID=A0A167XYG6_9FLAO|nr:hypothetical protein [Flavobacterium fryxellicola]OAB28826.1 hypothetical protein FBFR_04985 [Flavobacterium fryxellicola]SHN61310.1 hypothetical protein SAMN05444395_102467 [Flavobacterium fryxellicola]